MLITATLRIHLLPTCNDANIQALDGDVSLLDALYLIKTIEEAETNTTVFITGAEVTSFSFLGINIANNLSCSSHINTTTTTVKACSPRLHLAKATEAPVSLYELRFKMTSK